MAFEYQTIWWKDNFWPFENNSPLNIEHLNVGFFSLVFRPPLEYRTIWQPDTNQPFEYQTSPTLALCNLKNSIVGEGGLNGHLMSSFRHATNACKNKIATKIRPWQRYLHRHRHNHRHPALLDLVVRTCEIASTSTTISFPTSRNRIWDTA